MGDTDATGRPSLVPSAKIGGFLGLHFDPYEVDGQIALHGNDCEYRRGQLCPCHRPETGQGSIGCPACRGLGWVYPENLRCNTRLLDGSKQTSQRQGDAGSLQSGSAQVTFRIGILPARGDMVLPACEQHVVHEQFHRSVQQVRTSEMRDRIPPRGMHRPLPPRSERLLYPDPFAIEAVVYLSGSTAVVAKEGRDWRLASVDGGLQVEWLGTKGPAQGEGYSVRYVAGAAYMVMSSPANFRHEGNVAMPYRASLQRLDKVQEADLR